MFVIPIDLFSDLVLPFLYHTSHEHAVPIAQNEMAVKQERSASAGHVELVPRAFCSCITLFICPHNS
jgi:hypothetical protein